MGKESQQLSINIEAPKRFFCKIRGLHNLAFDVFQSELSCSRYRNKNTDHVKILNICLVTDRQIRKINRDYLCHDRPTDVISFSYLDELSRIKSIRCDVPFVAGDVVISHEMAKRMCVEFKNTFEKELSLYIIHGILHIFGFEDKNVKTRSIMWKRQNEYLNRFFPENIKHKDE